MKLEAEIFSVLLKNQILDIEINEINFTLNTTNKTDTKCDTPLLDGIDIAILAIKTVSLVFYLGLLTILLTLKEMRNRYSIYLLNILFIGVIQLLISIILFFEDCITYLKRDVFTSDFQGFLNHYFLYLNSYSVLALAVFRLFSVCTLNLKKSLSLSKILISIGVIYLVIFVICVIPMFVLDVDITYYKNARSYRMKLTDHVGYFVFFLLVGNCLPSLVMAGVYITFICKIKRSKNKIKPKIDKNNIKFSFDTKTSVLKFKKLQAKVTGRQLDDSSVNNNQLNDKTHGTIQGVYKKNKPNIDKKSNPHLNLGLKILLMYSVYFVFSLCNIVLVIDIFNEHDIDLKQANILRFFISIYFLVTPILFLILHPMGLDKVKNKLKGHFLQNKLGKMSTIMLDPAQS